MVVTLQILKGLQQRHVLSDHMCSSTQAAQCVLKGVSQIAVLDCQHDQQGNDNHRTICLQGTGLALLFFIVLWTLQTWCQKACSQLATGNTPLLQPWAWQTFLLQQHCIPWMVEGDHSTSLSACYYPIVFKLA